MTRLVLSRKRSETIVTDGPVRITVERIDGNRVKLSCVADETISIMREELIGKEPTDAESKTLQARNS